VHEPSNGTKADYSPEYTRMMRARLRVCLPFTYQHSWLFHCNHLLYTLHGN
jgi:hypothetical protein